MRRARVQIVAVALAAMLRPVAHSQGLMSISEIAKTVSESVVVVQGKSDDGDVVGSGFFVSHDGKVVTNLHVIKDLKTARVLLPDGRSFDAFSVVATDELRDLVILHIPGSNVPAVLLGDSDALVPGEPVVVVGNARGLQGTITAGILSAVRSVGEGFTVLQTDAAVNSGNSGGPLLNSKGQAIGVISFKLRSAEGLNFAVPIKFVRSMLLNPHQPRTLDEVRNTLSARSTTNRSNEPTLAETLRWLSEKIPLGMLRYSYDYDGKQWFIEWQSKVWSADNCTVQLGWGTTTIVDGRRSNASVLRYTVPLGTIDDGVIEKKPTVERATFTGGDSRKAVLRMNSRSKEILSEWFLQEKPIVSRDNYFDLIFNDEALAQRVFKALMHAANLCRGKEAF